MAPPQNMVSPTLGQLASALGGVVTPLVENSHSKIVVTDLEVNSSRVSAGMLFVAVRGAESDGHAFVEEAFSRGAAAAVVEDPETLKGRPGIVVQNGRIALSSLAAIFAGHPSRALCCVGVTGTNGKTTVHWLMHHLLGKLGHHPVRLGTLGVECPGVIREPGALTTPDPISLHRVLAKARQGGATAAVMETSSHALEQSRVDDVAFDVAIYTNLTRDHLDYHRSMEAYFLAKQRLFELMARGPKLTRAAVVNGDDPWGKILLLRTKTLGLNAFSYGRGEGAALRIIDERLSGVSTTVTFEFDRQRTSCVVPFIGKHNVENIAAAFAAALSLGYDLLEITHLMPLLPQVPGRLERLGDSNLSVFVDYAHSPDALENVLKALRPLCTGRLWVLFGCGGDRDRGKRSQMGEVAARFADRVVVTSDNPRTEGPEAIIGDILATGVKPTFTSVDRREAIRWVIGHASAGDVVLLAGKGHEDYQILGRERVHFSDQEEALAALGAAAR